MSFIYSYDSNDLCFDVIPWPEIVADFKKSKFDILLCNRWEKAKESGYFWYNLNDVKRKIIPGSISFIAQLNTKRFTQRRNPIEITSVQQNFDEKRFNFTKVKEHEILFQINHTQPSIQMSAKEKNLVIINVSPIDYGHTLLVPDVDACHPQVVTLNSMKLAIEICLLSKHRGLRIGFNSLCAYASVNHLHFHIMYINHILPLDKACGSHCGFGLFELNDYFIRGFIFQLENQDTISLARKVERVASYLYENAIPYNMFICRSDLFQINETSQKSFNGNAVKVFIFPKYLAPGIKDTRYMNSCCFDIAGYLLLKVKTEYAFNSAALESCGFLPIKGKFQQALLTSQAIQFKNHINDFSKYHKRIQICIADQEEYENLTEIDAVRILNKYSYKEDEFEELKNKLTYQLENSF